MAESLVSAKSFSFAVRIIHLCRHLKKQDVERELLSQLIRSGTSIAANLSEAVNYYLLTVTFRFQYFPYNGP